MIVADYYSILHNKIKSNHAYVRVFGMKNDKYDVFDRRLEETIEVSYSLCVANLEESFYVNEFQVAFKAGQQGIVGVL